MTPTYYYVEQQHTSSILNGIPFNNTDEDVWDATAIGGYWELEDNSYCRAAVAHDWNKEVDGDNPRLTAACGIKVKGL